MSLHHFIHSPGRRIALSATLVAFMFAGARATAAIVNVDEFGNGVAQTTAGNVPLPAGNGVDPIDPGNGLLPLIYNLGPATGGAPITPGDITLLEPLNGNLVESDLLRFTPNAQLIIYSDRADPGEVPIPLADIGFSTTGIAQPNALIMLENGTEAGPNGLFGYTPTPGQPGFVPTPPGAITYNFLSDPAVPEPSALGLLGCGACALLAYRPRRR